MMKAAYTMNIFQMNQLFIGKLKSLMTLMCL